jgi:Ca2+-binding RTX toxin-like protein
MVNWYGGAGNDYKDFLPYGSSNDYGFGDAGNDTMLGWYGNDTLDGWTGNDTLYGEYGNDTLLGYTGYDKLYGGYGDDYLYGEGSYDDLYGGMGVDKMWGGNDGSADYFYFYTQDTGDVYQNKADTIYDFADVDQIWLKGTYSYNASGTSAPSDGQYSIWKKGADWVVTYNAYNDTGYHDILVKGADPHGDISFF